MAQILVAGSSGLVGSELTKLLKAQGHSVRGTTSKREKADGKNLAYVDLTKGEGVTAAFEGVDRLFLLSPGGFADQYAMLSPMLQEAKRRGVRKVVLMTAMGANADENSPLRRAELELIRSGLTYVIIRPNWFMENFNTFWIHDIKVSNKIKLPAGAAKTSFIDTRDISAVAAKLFDTDEFDNQELDLTGPEAVDHSEVAKTISKVAGRTITYENVSVDSFKTALGGAGLQKEYVNFLALIIGFLREGYNARTTDNVKAVLGREPMSFAKYAEDNKAAF